MKKGYYFNENTGWLELIDEGGYLTGLYFVKEGGKNDKSPLLEKTREELLEYFDGRRREFSIPTKFTKGTEFQKKCWETLKSIPYGETVSYEEEATRVGNPKAIRAVGSANGQNPISIIIPCHRVINKSGKLGGYGGGLSVKEYLLKLEAKEKFLTE